MHLWVSTYEKYLNIYFDGRLAFLYVGIYKINRMQCVIVANNNNIARKIPNFEHNYTNEKIFTSTPSLRQSAERFPLLRT